MKRILFAVTAAAVVIALLVTALVWRGPERGLVLYAGGPILTMDASNSVAEALLYGENFGACSGK